MTRWILSLLALICAATATRAAAPFELKDGDRVVFLGDTLIEREQQYGWIELMLTTRFPDRRVTFRNLGWSADLPDGESRLGLSLTQAGHEPEGEAWKLLQKQIEETKPTVAFIGYGMAASFAGEAGLPKFKEDYNRLLDTIEKTDDYTVVMKLKEPNMPILANLAMDFASIHSAEYADFLMKAGKPEQFDQIPVGTGPFIFVAYQKDAMIRFKKNPDYFGEKALVDDLVFAITPDPTARLSKLKAGECHFAIAPRPADLEEIKKDKALQLISQSGLNVSYWAFNTEKPPFDKKEVRQAFNMAIDHDAIIKEVFLGSGTSAKNLIPPTLWSYNDKVPSYPYDPEKAKAMLKAAGVTTPLDIDLWYLPVQRPYNPNGKRMAEMMQADLAKIGVNAKLVTYEWGEYRKRMQKGEHMTGQLGWTGDNGDPDNFFFLRGCAASKGGLNVTKWCNKEYDDRLNKAKSLSDIKERTKLYEEMQVIEHEEAPDMKIGHSIVFEAMRAEVTGYKQSPFGSHEFQGVDIK